MCIPTCGQVIGRILCFQDFNPGLTGEARSPPVVSFNGLPPGCRIPSWMALNHVLSFCLRPLGCYNRIPQAGWLVNSKSLFPTVLEAGKSDHGTGKFSPLVRAHWLVYRWPSSCFVSTQERGEESQGLLSRGTNPIYEGSHHLPKCFTSKYVGDWIWGSRDTNIQSIAVSL